MENRIYLTGLGELHKCKIGNVRKVLKKEDVVTVYGEGEKRGNWKVANVETSLLEKA